MFLYHNILDKMCRMNKISFSLEKRILSCKSCPKRLFGGGCGRPRRNSLWETRGMNMFSLLCGITISMWYYAIVTDACLTFCARLRQVSAVAQRRRKPVPPVQPVLPVHPPSCAGAAGLARRSEGGLSQGAMPDRQNGRNMDDFDAKNCTLFNPVKPYRRLSHFKKAGVGRPCRANLSAIPVRHSPATAEASATAEARSATADLSRRSLAKAESGQAEKVENGAHKCAKTAGFDPESCR